jgi:hypothetical protein
MDIGIICLLPVLRLHPQQLLLLSTLLLEVVVVVVVMEVEAEVEGALLLALFQQYKVLCIL